MPESYAPEKIDPAIREIGPKPSGTGFPVKEVIEKVLNSVSNILFIENTDDLLEEIATTVRELFNIERIVIWISDEDDVRRPRIIQGYSDREKSELFSVFYTVEESNKTQSLANHLGPLSYFVPAEVVSIMGVDEETERKFGVDLEKAKLPRRTPDEWHELDYLNVSLLSREGKYIGSLEIEEPIDKKMPSLETIRAIEIFTTISSVAIEISKLREKEQSIIESAERRSEIISRILSFVKEILSISDPERLFEQVLILLTELFDFKAASIVLFDELENCFRYIAFKGYTAEEMQFSKTIRIPSESMRTDISSNYQISHDTYFIPGEELTDDWLKYEIQVEGEYEELLKKARQPRQYSSEWHELDNLISLIRDRDGRILGMLYPDKPGNGLVPSADTIEGIGIYTSLISIALQNSRDYMEAIRVKEEIDLLNNLLFNDVKIQNQEILSLLKLTLDAKGDKDQYKKQVKYLKGALKKLNSTISLINKVRKLSSVRAIQRSSLLRVDLINAIRNQVPRLISIFPKKDVKIQYGNMPEGCYIYANEMIGELFDILLENAIVHNRGNNVEIEISIDMKHDDFSNRDIWEIRVSDNGPGIPDNLKRAIFDISIHPSKISAERRIGLCIVRYLVFLYSGSIWVEDRVEGDHTKGSSFNILLPAA